jgi:hypothetical protein
MTKLFPCMPFLCCRPSSPLPQHIPLVFSANAMTVSSWVFSISPALAFPIWYFLKTRRPAHHLQHNLIKNSSWWLMPLPIFFFFSSWAFVHSKFDDVWLLKFVEDPQEIQSWSILEYWKKWEFIYSGFQNGYLFGNFLNFLLLDVQSSTFKLV